MELLLLGCTALLGTLAFFEPCTIATHTLFAVRNAKNDTRARLKQLTQLSLSRFILMTALLLAAVVLIGRIHWGGYGASIILAFFALIYVLSRIRYIPIPHLIFYKILPKAEKIPDGIQLGLTLPACTIPLFLTVMGFALTVATVSFAILAAAVFTLFFTLPTVYGSYHDLSKNVKDFLERTARATPFITAFIFLSGAIYLLFPEMEFSKRALEGIMAKPSLFAVTIGFFTGLIFSFNPVSFAAIPVALAYVTKTPVKKRARLLGVMFVCGLIFTHVILGLAAASGGEWVKNIMGRQWAAVLGGILLFLGFVWAGWLKINLPWLGLKGKKATSLWSAFLLGMPFSIAVCPFCSPALLVMLTASASIGSVPFGIFLLLAFAIGRSIPILLGTWSMAWLESLTFFSKWQRSFEILGGVTLILSGLYLLNAYYFII